MTTETNNPTPAETSGSPTNEVEPTPAAPKRPRRRWFLRIAVGLLVVLLLVVVLAPFILSMGFVRARIERTASEQLGSKVTLTDHSVGWGSLQISGIDIQNPDGFPQGQSAIKVAKVDANISLWSLITGTVVFDGTVDGVEVRLYEKADGTTNLQRFAEHAAKKDGGETTPEGQPDNESKSEPEKASDPHKLDFAITNGLIEIEHEKHGVIETLRELSLTVKKIPGNDLKVALNTKLQRPGDTSSGSLQVLADLDITGARPGTFMLETTGLDLSRYGSLLSLLGEEGERPLDSIAGKLEGKLEGTFQQNKQVTLKGKLVVEKPAFRGRIGEEKTPFALEQPRFVIEPNIVVPLQNGTVSPEQVDMGQFRIDLGLLQVQGLSFERASGLAAGKKGVGIDLDADLTAIVAAIGPLLPDELRKTRGKVTGLFCFAPDWSKNVADEFEKGGEQFLLGNLFAKGRVAIAHLDFQDYRLRNMNADMTITAGKVAMQSQPGATVNDGPATITVQGSLLEERLPVNIQLKWEKAQAKGDSVKLLRWAVPLLAGLDVNAPLDFSSLLDADLKLNGPAKPKVGQSTLEWLNEWSGTGKIALRDGSFTPAGQWKPVLDLLGKGKLTFNDIKSSFKLDQGGVHTEMMRFNDKTQSWGVSGAVKLDGTMDFKIDLSDLVKQRKDAKEIMKLLGNKPIEASLGGTLDTPKLNVPIKDMLQKALTQGVKTKLENEAKKGLEKKINKGLEDLFKKRRRKKR